jgi:hypothetical protein
MPVLPPFRRFLRPALVALSVVAAALAAPPSVRPACAQGPDAAQATDPAWASQPGAVCPARATDTQRKAALIDRLREKIAASAPNDGSAPVALNGNGYNYGSARRPGAEAALLEFEAKRK